MTLFQIISLVVFCLVPVSLVIFSLLYIKYLIREPKNEKEEKSLLYDFPYSRMSCILDFDRYDYSYLETVLYYHYDDNVESNSSFIDTFRQIRFRSYDIVNLKNKHLFDYKKFIEIDDIKQVVEKYNFLLYLQIKRYNLIKKKLNKLLINGIKNKRQLNFYYEVLKDLKIIDKYILPDLNYYYFKVNRIELIKIAKECKFLFDRIKKSYE